MELNCFREHEKKENFEISEKVNKSKLFEHNGRDLQMSYFIGVDWIVTDKQAIYVEPKINEVSKQTNYLQMLFSALKHIDVGHTKELFEINFDAPSIKIEQKQDLLTPLLVVQFLGIVQKIVKKGLKKSYYKVEKNLTAKTKGKILVNQTIKKNIVKNDILKTYCSYEEFGFNGLENRLLKKTLSFVQRYLPTIPHLEKNNVFITNTFNYILPAFETISNDIEINEIKHTKFNSFYKEYAEATRLAKIILKRFGYNINNTSQTKSIKTPPFWIDMAKLFELYVLGLLKNELGNEVEYHQKGNYGETDFILQNPKMIIDAKYKKAYLESNYVIEDIRQVSGYARDTNVLRKLKCYDESTKNATEIVSCLIIHYEKDLLSADEIKNYKINLGDKKEITEFVKFYKLGVKLPEI